MNPSPSEPPLPPASTAGPPSAIHTPTMPQTHQRLLGAAAAVLIVGAFFLMLGWSPLNEPDEARYAEIAREMLETRDWITPHLNYVKYFEKPPLVYWLTAASFAIFGLNDFTARLWPALFGLLGVGCAWTLARNIYGPGGGLLAAMILATTPLYFALSQVLVLDMPLAALMALALTAAWFCFEGQVGGENPTLAPAGQGEGASRPHSIRGMVYLFYIAAALAVLTKGPVAIILLGAILTGFAILRGSPRLLSPFLCVRGIGLFLLITLPWFAVVSLRNPEFAHFFIVEQHFNRYLRPSEHREHLLFFVPIILAGMLPWTFILGSQPRLWMNPLRRLVTLRASRGTTFCAVWAVVIFAFFSLSGSKLATYILPLFCPLAVLGAGLFVKTWQDQSLSVYRWFGWILTVLAAGCLITAIVVPFVSAHYNAPSLPPPLYRCAVVFGLFATILLREWKSPNRSPGRLLAIVMIGMLAVQAGIMTGRDVSPEYSELAFAIRKHAQPSDQVVMYAHYTQGIPYYTRRRAVMVRSWGELDFGKRQGDQSAWFWPSDATLIERWRSERMFLVINRSELIGLRDRMDPAPREIASKGKKVLLANFPD